MKYTISATIPTVQYGNLQPSIEVEADTFEDARALVMPEIQSVWNSVCEEGKELVIKGAVDVPQVAGKRMKVDIGDIEYLSLDGNHVYTDDEGNKYSSGSVFAESFAYDFDKAKILPLYANKVGETTDRISDYWESKSKLSTDFGTAIHQAMETYGKFNSLSEKLEKPLGIHPIVLPVVESFFAERGDEEALYEPFVADSTTKRCGQIDRLVITGEKTCIIEDFKTNIDLNKAGSPKYLKAPYDKDGEALENTPLGKYTIQLNFYRSILESRGWKVEGMRIHHLDDSGWNEIDVPVVKV